MPHPNDFERTLLPAKNDGSESSLRKINALLCRDLSVVVTPTITTAPYADGDSVGGKILLEDAMAVSEGAALLHSIVITDASNQKATGNLILFESNPEAATLADNAAVQLSTDLAKIVEVIPLTEDDWVTIDSKAVASLRNLGSKVKANGGRDLYLVFQNVTTTPTYAVGALKFRLNFLQAGQ